MFNVCEELYNKNSFVQQQIAKDLIKYCHTNNLITGNILDIGSGTGYIGKLLSKYSGLHNLFQIDSSTNMVQASQNSHPNSVTKLASAECTGFNSKTFNLVTSSMCLQWANIGLAAKEVARILTDNGYFIASLPVNGSFIELKDNNLFDAIFYKLPTVTSLTEHFKITSVLDYKFEYESVLHFLKTMRNVGAVPNKPNNIQQTSQTLNFVKYYKKQTKIAITWKIAFITLK